MTYPAPFHRPVRLHTSLAIAGLAFLTGCNGVVESPPSMMSAGSGNVGTGAGTGNGVGSTGNPGAGGSGQIPAGGTGTSPGAGTGNTGTPGGGAFSTAGTGSTAAGTAGIAPTGACEGTDVAARKRLVRLSFNQIANTIGALINPTLASQIVTDQSIPPPEERTFPPLASTQEGYVVTATTWGRYDSIASTSAKYVLDNLATVTGCAAPPTDACSQAWANGFAEKAYRRPLTDLEKTRFAKVYADVKAAGGTVNESVQYSVYAALSSPQFLYRTEFGTGAPTADSPLTPYEIASALSYFLGDAPPDQALLDAAAQGRLATPADIGAQVTRIAAIPAAKQNIYSALMAYFQFSRALDVVIPGRTDFYQSAVYHEAELFLSNTMWSNKIGDLLTSRRSYVNAQLAGLYGIAFPPAGATLDKDMFAAVDLPENRAGILTNPAFLVSRNKAGGDAQAESVVGRGLLVSEAIICQENPPFPEEIAAQIDAVSQTLVGKSEAEKSQYRTENSPCKACHANFDAFGLALESFDEVGKFRTVDEGMFPVNPASTLPPSAGGNVAKNAVEMAAQIVSSGAFAKCMSKNMIAYALAEPVELKTKSCSTEAVARAHQATDQTFVSLLKEVAMSRTFTNRVAGGATP